MPGSNFLLLLIWLGSKFDFQVTNLLLVTTNFEPRILYVDTLDLLFTEHDKYVAHFVVFISPFT